MSACSQLTDSQYFQEWLEAFNSLYPQLFESYNKDLENPQSETDHTAFDIESFYADEPECAKKPRAKALFDNSINHKDWLNSYEAAAFLGTSVGVLRNETSNGKVPYYKYGRRNRYLKSELEKLLSTNKRGDF